MLLSLSFLPVHLLQSLHFLMLYFVLEDVLVDEGTYMYILMYIYSYM